MPRLATPIAPFVRAGLVYDARHGKRRLVQRIPVALGGEILPAPDRAAWPFARAGTRCIL